MLDVIPEGVDRLPSRAWQPAGARTSNDPAQHVLAQQGLNREPEVRPAYDAYVKRKQPASGCAPQQSDERPHTQPCFCVTREGIEQSLDDQPRCQGEHVEQGPEEKVDDV